MTLTFAAYWPAIFLLAIPYIWWVRKGTVTDLSSKHLRLSGAIRSAIVLLLALALMQPVLHRSGTNLSVVYLLDVSQSVSAAAIQSGINWIAATNESGKPAKSGMIPFGANALYLDDVEQLKKVKVSNAPASGSIDQSGTNIEEAVDLGLRNLAPDHLKRLVLLSDGNENTQKLMQIVPRLKEAGVHVYTVPLQPRMNRDAWIETILAPSQVTDGEIFPVEVQVYSQSETSGEVLLKRNSKTLDSKKVALRRGLNRIEFEPRLTGESGPITLEAGAAMAGDSFPENNTYRAALNVVGQPKILYAEGFDPSAHYLKDALTKEGLIVDVVRPESIPSRIEALDGYAAVILSDVSRSSLSDAQMQTLAAYVKDLGGGFILAGGENNYGEGGYSKTVVEDMLPVTFQAQKDDVAMIVVLDKSGSMGGERMDLAKEATKAPLLMLKDTDKFGVVAFDYEFFVPVPLAFASNREKMREGISRIVASGETNIYPALEKAYKELVNDSAKTKHIILLSDGRSLPDEFERLTKQIAQSKITVSSVAVGATADKELMTKIAMWGGGRTYYLEDPTKVPQVFTKEAEMATSRSIRESPFKPVVKKTIEAFKGIDFSKAPNLLGYVTTKAKATSEIIMESDDVQEPEPILARWQYGLGKTVVFTSDVKNRWAAEWVQWIDYSKFWAQLVRETMRRQDDQEFDMSVSRDGESASITINAIEKTGQFRNKLKAQVRIIAPDQSVSVVDVPQIGPGAYETRVPLKQKGSYVFRAAGPENGSASRLLAYSYPDEYHFYSTNSSVLQSVSTATGGVFQPTAEQVFAPNGETVPIPTELWRILTGLALMLFLADVLLRRFRPFMTRETPSHVAQGWPKAG